jgi:hypothetical protein
MKSTTTIKCGLILTVLLITSISLTSFRIVKNEVPGPKDPVKLVYNFAEGKSVTYHMTTSVTQAMDINGQTMNVLVNNNMAFKVKMAGKSDANLKLEILMDSISTKVDAMQASQGGKVKDIEGKSFIMIISPYGKEVDLSEASKVEYTTEGSGPGNLSQAFASIFPDLPENAVKPGDTWTKTDTINTKTATSSIIQIIQSTNKFEGIEKNNGFECAKISSSITGTSQISAQSNGMDLFISGPVQGTVTLYFAVKEGYFVRQETISKMNGTVEISGPQSMTFPMVMDSSSKIEIAR